MSLDARRYDVVVLGATGFTGRLLATYISSRVQQAQDLERAYPKPAFAKSWTNLQARSLYADVGLRKSMSALTWAVAGRNLAKLNELRMIFPESSRPDVMFVDTEKDVKSVQDCARSTRVVISTAGPFTRLGTVVVRACVENGTDYVDSTGETPWVKSLIEEFHQEARKTGSKIVPMCGFDSIPSDLGVLYAVNKLRERGAGSVESAKIYVRMLGGMSGGTLETGIMMEKNPELHRIVKNPFALGGGPVNQEHAERARPLIGKHEHDPHLGHAAWTAPGVMEELNTRVVRRSADLCRYRTSGKGGFHVQEVSIHETEDKAKKAARPGPPAEKRAELVSSGALPKPGEGPSEALRNKSFFQLLVRAQAEDVPGLVQWVSISGGEPGYQDTAIMVAESGLCLALEREGLPPIGGGVWTTAAAMGSNLIERLNLIGIRFRAVQSPKDNPAVVRSSL